MTKIILWPRGANAVRYEYPRGNIEELLRRLGEERGTPYAVRVYVNGGFVAVTQANWTLVPPGWADVTCVDDSTSDWMNKLAFVVPKKSE